MESTATPTPMNSQTQLRLDEIELKTSYLEDVVEKLDAVIIRQQAQIEALIREIVTIKQSSTDGGYGAPRNLRDDLPPHF
jgi:SlyX protein